LFMRVRSLCLTIYRSMKIIPAGPKTLMDFQNKRAR
jgi:hypothetical protein